jgi:hypothetical protein
MKGVNLYILLKENDYKNVAQWHALNIRLSRVKYNHHLISYCKKNAEKDKEQKPRNPGIKGIKCAINFRFVAYNKCYAQC